MKTVYAFNGQFFTPDGEAIRLFETVVYPKNGAPYDASCDVRCEIVTIETAPAGFRPKEGSKEIPLPPGW